MTLYIVFEKELWLFYYNDGFALRHSLFGAVKLTKNIDPDSYSYSGYGISFDICRTVSFLSSGCGKNVIIFGTGMSSSSHIGNKIKIT